MKARGRMTRDPKILGAFYECHTHTTKVEDDSKAANGKGCRICGARPVLRLVHRRGYCKDHVNEAFTDARISFEPMKLKGMV